MTNPSPRPALRKAPDADIHPAVPGTEPVTIDLRAPANADHGVETTVQAFDRVPAKTTDPTRKKKESNPRPAKAKSGADASKLKAKRIALRVKVPREIRHKLRATAKARGTSVDDVVSTVLEGWLDK